ncbi:dentin sialophosphoprotein-like [Hetaerina americana]|uniref:dentin sialophosphoprotein-like n=1 Tax=Hetaerina americana TaxID=62018 RepID=UPI003A7F40CD
MAVRGSLLFLVSLAASCLADGDSKNLDPMEMRQDIGLLSGPGISTRALPGEGILVYEYEGHVYRFHHEDRVTWEKARAICESEGQGSYLAVIEDLEEAQFLSEAMAGSLCNFICCVRLKDTDRGHWEPELCVEEGGEKGDTCKFLCNPEYQLSGTPEELGEDFVDKINDTLSNGKEAGLLFLLDESVSVSPAQFNMELTFVKALAAAFPLSMNRSAGVITFSHVADVDIELGTNDTCDFLSKANQIVYTKGGTNILNAMNLAVTEITRNAVHNLTLIFLVTDGISTTDPTPAADKLKAEGNVVFTIGVADYQREQLEPLATLGDDGSPNFFGVSSFEVFNVVANYLNTKLLEETNGPQVDPENVPATQNYGELWTQFMPYLDSEHPDEKSAVDSSGGTIVDYENANEDNNDASKFGPTTPPAEDVWTLTTPEIPVIPVDLDNGSDSKNVDDAPEDSSPDTSTDLSPIPEQPNDNSSTGTQDQPATNEDPAAKDTLLMLLKGEIQDDSAKEAGSPSNTEGPINLQEPTTPHAEFWTPLFPTLNPSGIDVTQEKPSQTTLFPGGSDNETPVPSNAPEPTPEIPAGSDYGDASKNGDEKWRSAPKDSENEPTTTDVEELWRQLMPVFNLTDSDESPEIPYQQTSYPERSENMDKNSSAEQTLVKPETPELKTDISADVENGIDDKLIDEKPETPVPSTEDSADTEDAIPDENIDETPETPAPSTEDSADNDDVIPNENIDETPETPAPSTEDSANTDDVTADENIDETPETPAPSTEDSADNDDVIPNENIDETPETPAPSTEDSANTDDVTADENIDETPETPAPSTEDSADNDDVIPNENIDETPETPAPSTEDSANTDDVTADENIDETPETPAPSTEDSADNDDVIPNENIDETPETPAPSTEDSANTDDVTADENIDETPETSAPSTEDSAGTEDAIPDENIDETPETPALSTEDSANTDDVTADENIDETPETPALSTEDSANTDDVTADENIDETPETPAPSTEDSADTDDVIPNGNIDETPETPAPSTEDSADTDDAIPGENIDETPETPAPSTEDSADTDDVIPNENIHETPETPALSTEDSADTEDAIPDENIDETPETSAPSTEDSAGTDDLTADENIEETPATPATPALTTEDSGAIDKGIDDETIDETPGTPETPTLTTKDSADIDNKIDDEIIDGTAVTPETPVLTTKDSADADNGIDETPATREKPALTTEDSADIDSKTDGEIIDASDNPLSEQEEPDIIGKPWGIADFLMKTWLRSTDKFDKIQNVIGVQNIVVKYLKETPGTPETPELTTEDSAEIDNGIDDEIKDETPVTPETPETTSDVSADIGYSKSNENGNASDNPISEEGEPDIIDRPADIGDFLMNLWLRSTEKIDKTHNIIGVQNIIVKYLKGMYM